MPEHIVTHRKNRYKEKQCRFLSNVKYIKRNLRSSFTDKMSAGGVTLKCE
jgi:hypothetical protein